MVLRCQPIGSTTMARNLLSGRLAMDFRTDSYAEPASYPLRLAGAADGGQIDRSFEHLAGRAERKIIDDPHDSGVLVAAATRS